MSYEVKGIWQWNYLSQKNMVWEIFFLKNHPQNVVEKLVPKPFSIKPKLSISLDQKSEILYSLFLLYIQVKGYQNILKLRCWQLAFTLNKCLLKYKIGLN